MRLQVANNTGCSGPDKGPRRGWRTFRAWFFVGIGVLGLFGYLPDYYNRFDLLTDIGFSIAMFVLFLLIGLQGLRTGSDHGASWSWYALFALLLLDLSRDWWQERDGGTFGALRDALYFREPVASVFLYLAMAAIVAIMFIESFKRSRATSMESAFTGEKDNVSR